MKTIINKIPFKKIGMALVIIFVLMQFIRIDKTNPPLKPDMDFINVSKTPPGIAQIIKTSCYDCHSHETVYPWYTNIAPVSWWLKDHVNEARRHLNFSEWTTYSSKKADHKLEECVENVQEGEMPLSSYTLIHRNAILSNEQQQALSSYFGSLRTHESDEE